MGFLLFANLIQLFLLLHNHFSNKKDNNDTKDNKEIYYDQGRFSNGMEDARKILDNYTRVFDTQGIGIASFFHSKFSLHLCKENEREYTKLDMMRGLYVAPYYHIKFHEMEIVRARFLDQSCLKFVAKPVVNGNYRGLIYFEAEKKPNGEYELKKQSETFCPEDVYTPTMINYEKTAEQLAKVIMTKYVDAISQRSLPKLYNLFIDRKSYRLKYCHKVKPITYRDFDFDLQMPFYHKSEIHEKYHTMITNAKMKKDGSISFEVHGGAFNNYFEATKVFDSNFNGMSFLLEFDQDLGCQYSERKKLDLNELQYSVFSW